MSRTLPVVPLCSNPFEAQSVATTEEILPTKVDLTNQDVKVDALVPWSPTVIK